MRFSNKNILHNHLFFNHNNSCNSCNAFVHNLLNYRDFAKVYYTYADYSTNLYSVFRLFFRKSIHFNELSIGTMLQSEFVGRTSSKAITFCRSWQFSVFYVYADFPFIYNRKSTNILKLFIK